MVVVIIVVYGFVLEVGNVFGEYWCFVEFWYLIYVGEFFVGGFCKFVC